MPQMAPLNWVSLYLMFTFIFLMFNIMNYYTFNYKIKTMILHKNKKLFNWKW
uniref:ATP synthase complex subunit 8 n=2 Tax=Coleoptera TaxID=7041 RepID=A0A346RFL5_9COLE|nr:ATP synthase F0 subunit 8 [Coleoptera sp. 2 KM-2017]AXS66003.1 ATP synthase F0 subunit 8 [Cucujoidea sp. 36 KM-2017]